MPGKNRVSWRVGSESKGEVERKGKRGREREKKREIKKEGERKRRREKRREKDREGTREERGRGKRLNKNLETNESQANKEGEMVDIGKKETAKRERHGPCEETGHSKRGEEERKRKAKQTREVEHENERLCGPFDCACLRPLSLDHPAPSSPTIRTCRG